MNGQILSGQDPMSAIRYQIVIMFMRVASTALAVTWVLTLVRRQCFGPGQRDHRWRFSVLIIRTRESVDIFIRIWLFCCIIKLLYKVVRHA